MAWLSCPHPTPPCLRPCSYLLVKLALPVVWSACLSAHVGLIQVEVGLVCRIMLDVYVICLLQRDGV